MSQNPYPQTTPILSLLNSVRIFASRNPSPEKHLPPDCSPKVSQILTNTNLNHHEPRSPDPHISLFKKYKAGLLQRVMEEMKKHEPELSQEQLEQTPCQREPHEDEQAYQTLQEHDGDVDMAVNTCNPHGEDEYILQHSYFPEPRAGIAHIEDWNAPRAPPPTPVVRARAGNTVRGIPPAPSPAPTLRAGKHMTVMDFSPARRPFPVLRAVGRRGAVDGVPPERRNSDDRIEGFGRTWPPQEPRIISLLTDSSPSSRAASPAPASPASDSDIIITHATPIRHKRPSPPSNSSSLSPSSSKFNSSSSTSSSDELTITNATSHKRPSNHTHFPSPKRQRCRHVRLKTGPWGNKERMLLVESLQRGVNFITLGQKMRRDVDDVFEKFSEVVAAVLYENDTKDSSTQTDEISGDERQWVVKRNGIY